MLTSQRRVLGKTLATIAVAALIAVGTAHAAEKVRSDRNIVEGAAGADNLKTLVTAVQAADLAETLSGAGPFTVFAPTDEAFARLPEGTVESLLKAENKDQLQAILTYHVVPTEATAEAVVQMIQEGGGEARVTTVQGEMLTLMLEAGERVVIEDAQGNVATVTAADILQSNGVVHVIDNVLMPAG